MGNIHWVWWASFVLYFLSGKGLEQDSDCCVSSALYYASRHSLQGGGGWDTHITSRHKSQQYTFFTQNLALLTLNVSQTPIACCLSEPTFVGSLRPVMPTWGRLVWSGLEWEEPAYWQIKMRSDGFLRRRAWRTRGASCWESGQWLKGAIEGIELTLRCLLSSCLLRKSQS
jgi:hypothetical protein